MAPLPSLMASSRASSSKAVVGNKLAILAFPEDLKFVEAERTTHKQVLTVYNPYDFDVQYKILSNVPSRYSVVQSGGIIKAKCYVDIVVRHQTVGLGEGPYDTADKFRIDFICNKKVVGSRIISSTLVKEGKEVTGSSWGQECRFRTVDPSLNRSSDSQSKSTLPPDSNNKHSSSGLLLVFLALLCLLVLLLPLDGESPAWPSYLHISVNQKLIAAFALGLVTMAILKL